MPINMDLVERIKRGSVVNRHNDENGYRISELEYKVKLQDKRIEQLETMVIRLTSMIQSEYLKECN